MLFSVIVPVYNVKGFIRPCVDSILSQSFRDYEVLLVDDGSTDGSSAICDEYEQKEPRVRVIHKQNGGLVSARNAGIAQANGEYILYVDGDDWVSEKWLEVIRHQIVSAPEKPDIVVFGSVMVYDNRQRNNIINTEAGFYDRTRLEKEIFPRLLCDLQLEYGEAVFLPASWNKAFKIELLRAHRCFDEGIRLGEDTAYVFECLLNAKSAVVCKEILYYYNRLNLESTLSRDDPNRINKRLHLFQYIKTRLAGYGPVIDQQMYNFYASRIIYDLSFLQKKTDDIFKTGGFLAKELRETRILKYVRLRGIPFRVKIIILMLKLGLCRTVLLCIKIWNRLGRRLAKKNGCR